MFYRKTICFLAFALAAFGAQAKLKCETNPMTDEKTCESEKAGGLFMHYRIVATTEGDFYLLVTAARSYRIDTTTVMARVDGGEAFDAVKGNARSMLGSCYMGCTYQVYGVAYFTAEQWERIANGTEVLLSFGSGNDPIKLKQGKIRAMLAELAAAGFTPPDA